MQVAAARPARPARRLGTAFWVLVLLAVVLRIGYMAATPDYSLVHDARDYDRHAQSIASGHGYAWSVKPGRPTAFRPPGYPYVLAGVYRIAGVEHAVVKDRIHAARIAGVVVGALIVVLVGLIAIRLWGRRVGLVAMGLAAVYVPLITVGGAVMSEPLFALYMLAALALVLVHRASPHAYRYAVVAGVLAGLMILTRANALVLLLPLAIAVWDRGPWRSLRATGPPAALVVVALLTVSPWTIRNAVVFDRFIPVSTQLGSALAGTYNDVSRNDRNQPASWRSRGRVPPYEHLYGRVADTPEPVVEDRLRAASRHYISEHPGYVATVAYWSTRRMFETTGRTWWRHTASTVSIPPGWADAGVYCFWLFAALAFAGCFARRARGAPAFIWAVPLLLYLSVVFLVVETPRYRTGIDPFIVMLAALAVVAAADRIRAARRG
jgi:4-amino-4-deoxy-L-arabinose transferase-like glycosyltransferase